MYTMNLIAARAFSTLVLALFSTFLATLSSTAALADTILPPEVAAALARAGVPQDALSVVVVALPAATPAAALVAHVASSTTAHITTAEPVAALPANNASPTLSPRLLHRPDVPRNPASVMKLVTTYAALDTLGPHFTWKNRVYVDGFVGQNGQPGVLEGNLVLRGSGDPKLVLERIQDLFAQIQAKGVREVRGDIILDRSIFNVPDKNPADFDDEPLRPYNAAPDGLLVNFKSLIFTFTPDPANQRVLVKYEPPIAGVEIPTELPLASGNCGDWKMGLRAEFFTPNKISFLGHYAASCGEKVWPVAYNDPLSYAVRVIDAMWAQAGGKLTGTVREAPMPRTSKSFLVVPSLPLSEIIADVNKFSNNVMAQQVFLTLSSRNEPGPLHKQGSFEASRRMLAAWWKATLPNAAPPVLENGSGLSRKERSSASALAALLLHAGSSANALVFANSLGTAGVDGTVARMKDRNAQSIAIGNAQLKTGTLKDVVAVAGYANSLTGQRYVLVAIVNHPNAGAARPALDKLVEWVVRDAR